MSEFTSFVERPEKVEAFQFNGPHQVDQVLDAFDVPHDVWSLQRTNKNYRLNFPLKNTAQATITRVGDVYYGELYAGATISLGTLGPVAPSGTYSVPSGSWVVKRYIDTDHPEVTVLSDKEFRRKYRAQIEAA